MSAENETHESDYALCNMCGGVWCDRCDPAHGPLCPWCHGRGASTAGLVGPAYRGSNHLLPQLTDMVAGDARHPFEVAESMAFDWSPTHPYLRMIENQTGRKETEESPC